MNYLITRVMGGSLFALVISMAFAVPAMIGPTAQAQSFKQHCQARCTANKLLCTESTLPNIVPGGGTAAGCTNDCVATQRTCETRCTGRNAAACRQTCNQSLSSCTTACSNRVQRCNDQFVSCRTRCDTRPQCVLNSDCGGGTCVNGTCEAPCNTNQQCQQRMGPDSRCIVPPNTRIGRCALV